MIGTFERLNVFRPPGDEETPAILVVESASLLRLFEAHVRPKLASLRILVVTTPRRRMALSLRAFVSIVAQLRALLAHRLCRVRLLNHDTYVLEGRRTRMRHVPPFSESGWNRENAAASFSESALGSRVSFVAYVPADEGATRVVRRFFADAGSFARAMRRWEEATRLVVREANAEADDEVMHEATPEATREATLAASHEVMYEATPEDTYESTHIATPEAHRWAPAKSVDAMTPVERARVRRRFVAGMRSFIPSALHA